MPVAVGSAGDIISLCLLIKAIVKALHDSRGSSHSFQRLVVQLQALERALLEVDLLIRKHETSPELNALCVAAGQAASNCRNTAGPFLIRLRTFQQSLRPGGTRNKVKDALRKVQWATLHEDEVDKFYAEVAAHTASLNMLLITWSIAAIDFYGSETKQALAAAEELERASNRTQEGLLQQILTRVDKAVFVSKNTHLALQKALSLTRLSWLRHLGSELMAMMAKVQSITFKTYATVLSLNDKVTWLSSQTILLQEPCILTDALGRPSPLHVQFINCWDALDAVLEIRFRNLPGHDKILHKEYSLIDGQTGREMDRVRPLDTILVPGQQLQIEMIFHAARAWFTRDDSRDFLTEPADRTAHISGEFKASEATAIDLDASAHENGLHKSKKNHILNGVSCEDLLPFDASTALNIPIETACPFHLDEGVSYALLPGQEDPSLENSHLHKDGEKEILVAVTDLCNHLLPSDDNYSTLLVSLEEEHHPSTFQKARVLLPRAEQRRNVGGTYDHFPRQPNACVTVPCTTVDKGDQCESGEPQSSKYRSNVQTCSSGKLLDSDRMSVLRIPSEIGIGGKRSATQHPRPAQHVQSSNSRQKVRASHPDHMLRMPCLCSSIEKGPSTCLKAGSSLSSCRSLPNVIENDHKKRDINDGKFRQNQGANMRKTRRHLK